MSLGHGPPELLLQGGPPKNLYTLMSATLQQMLAWPEHDIIMGQGGRIGRTWIRQTTRKRGIWKKRFVASRAFTRDGGCASQRAISTTRLRTLPPFHLWPIDVVISHGPLKKSHLVAGFALICL